MACQRPIRPPRRIGNRCPTPPLFSAPSCLMISR
jgi:hypothetical protein